VPTGKQDIDSNKAASVALDSYGHLIWSDFQNIQHILENSNGELHLWIWGNR
jgi:hypothetical protein